ncbi:echinoderm microtubule-associated protein-like CG42247 isoform X1 [Adelges cooleyi]|uniref:echinoderm microtubule-associated protein-like CG42247 isoform X1 n=1 Tax=Adelges cooleyi TaxID=133065 RepID=UPI00217F9207|nr:echinoderm microtubule-associated protein-like CG42247 isoform X1 [Adelges cooleyi]
MLAPTVIVQSSSRPSSTMGEREPTMSSEPSEEKHEPNVKEIVAPARMNVLQPEKSESEDEEDQEVSRHTQQMGRLGPAGYWQSVPNSRGASPGMDNASETSSVMPAPVPGLAASRISKEKYNHLSYWKARKVTFYKNGDPYFPGLELRFRPGRDIGNLEALFDKLSSRMDLPRGARYLFSMDGSRVVSLDQLEDDQSYVVSSYKSFKSTSYGKKTSGWNSTTVASGSGWSRQTSMSRKQSVIDPNDLNTATSGLNISKSSTTRVIRIINNFDHTVQCRVLLNLRTTQPFEEVIEDLGHVLKMNNAKRMLTVSNQEVRSFSQLRNEYADVDTFYITSESRVMSPPFRRSRSRGALAVEPINTSNKTDRQRRARSKSRPRALYAADTDIVKVPPDYSVLDVMKEDPIRVLIRGTRRTYFPPMVHPPADDSPPDKRVTLNWVYGYRGIDTRKNLWVLPTGELLYYVAAVAVLYDRDEDSQRHYIGHTEDIQCMDIHPSKEMVASAQKGGRTRKTQAHIRIWSPETLYTLYIVGNGEFEEGVSAIAFSQLTGGNYLLAVDCGREKMLSVWQWQWGHLLGKVATMQTEDILGASFHPLDDNLMITYGKGHLTFWTRRKDGFFEKIDIIKAPSRTIVTSLQFEQEGDVITADGDGFITVYSVDSDGAYYVRMEFEAHNKGINALIMLPEGTLLSGGDKDRKIIAWDSLQNYNKITETKLTEVFGGVRSLCPQRPGRNDGNIYVGTIKNHVLEGSMQRRFNRIIFGHSKQLWGLAVHPDDELFATAGYDKNISLWKRHTLLWSTQITYECVSLTFHPFGTALVAGSVEGYLVILNAESGAVVSSVRVCGSALTCMGFNPAGDTVAVGSQNGSLYLYRVSRDGLTFKKSNKIRGVQPLVHLDWSTDGHYLQTVTAEYDLVYWDVKGMMQEKSAPAMKDVKWYTYNSSVGYLVSGIWHNRFYPTTSLISTANRSAAHDLYVTGDTDGYLRLFRYPCIQNKSEYNEEKVYSGQISSARFLYNDRNVVTVGGTDASLMLWDVVED